MSREASCRASGDGPASLTVLPTGRVNLIGEHIDYEGYAVLPMAIRQVCISASKESATPSAKSPALHVAVLLHGKLSVI